MSLDAGDTPPKPRKRSIKSSYSIHDRTHFEAIFRYPFFTKSEDEIRNHTFELNSYFIFPNQILPQDDNYPRESFYKNLKALVRLRQPKLSFRNIIHDLEAIAEQLDSHIGQQSSIDHEFLINDIRLSVCSFYRFFFRKIRKFLAEPHKILPHNLEKELSITNWADNLINHLSQGNEILLQIKRIRARYEEADIKNLNDVTKELSYAEEYALYIFLDCLASIKNTLKKLRANGTEYPELLKFVNKLIEKKREEATSLYPYYPDEHSPPETLETYVMQRSFLKKRMQSVLYLDVRQKPFFLLQRQTGAMIAAGFAAAWWITAELILINMSTSGRLSLQNMTAGGFLIITAFILAYILKDRIKETGRRRFKSGFLWNVPDHSNEVYYQPDNKTNVRLGKINEYAYFRKKSELPDELKSSLHNLTQLYEEDIDRGVIHYRKTFNIQPQAIIQSQEARLRAIHDILRLNFSRFLPMLDDPVYRRLALDSEHQVTNLTLPKRYYVHMIVNYSIRENRKKAKVFSATDTVRLVINKGGLVRIDILAKDQQI